MKSTTPRPGGRSPCTLPSQSEMWTWPILPLNVLISALGVDQREMGDVDIGLHGGQTGLVQKPAHLGEVIDER